LVSTHIDGCSFRRRMEFILSVMSPPPRHWGGTPSSSQTSWVREELRHRQVRGLELAGRVAPNVSWLIAQTRPRGACTVPIRKILWKKFCARRFIRTRTGKSNASDSRVSTLLVLLLFWICLTVWNKFFPYGSDLSHREFVMDICCWISTFWLLWQLRSCFLGDKPSSGILYMLRFVGFTSLL